MQYPQYPFLPNTAFIDTAATDHYAQVKAPLDQVKPFPNANPIYLTDGSVMKSTHTGILPNLPNISTYNKTAQICPSNNNISLISLGKLCDDGCEAKINKNLCKVYKNKETILTAPRCPKTGMYVMNIQHPNPPNLANASLANKQYKLVNIHDFIDVDRTKFLHAALGGLPFSTIKQAIRAGYLHTWPGLTEKSINKLQEPDHTILGHMDHVRKNRLSTKVKEISEWDLTLETHLPNKSHNFLHKIIDIRDTIYTDQTGKFTCTSKRGNNYIFITYAYDANAILVRPLKSRKGKELVDKLSEIHEYLEERGYKPNHQILDNETSQEMKAYLKGKEVTFQFVPPHNHRKNAAERAIRTFKNHFITILCMLHPNFPMSLWCRLLKQAEMTLNMVRPCRINPRMSAYTSLEGEFNYNNTPLAPLGSMIIAGDSASTRTSWAPHGTKAWYIGPAMNHYRCVEVYIPKTNGIAIADTFKWSDSNPFKKPKISFEEQLATAAHDLASTIKNNNLYLLPNQDLRKNINQLESLFRTSVEQITMNKLTPLAPEQTNEDIKIPITQNDATVDPPRVIAKSPRVIAESPRVKTSNPSNPETLLNKSLYRTISPKIVHEDTSKHLAEAYHQGTFQREPPIHRYPTRTKIARAAATVQQLEASQLKHHPSPTFNFDSFSIENPPTELKYKDLLQSEDKHLWSRGMCNELGRLSQGYHNIAGNNTLYFIHKSKVPSNKRVTYARIVCSLRPQKSETHRVRITAGGNITNYKGDPSTPVCSIETIKLHWNSVLSTPGAKYCTADLKDFFLMAALEEYEYLRIHISLIPDEFIKLYKLDELKDKDGYVYAEVHGGMYGFPQAGMLAHKDLTKRLTSHGYTPATYTPGLWTHKSNGITFTLVVDDFGIKYTSLSSLNHLLDVLKTFYNITINMKGDLYIGVTLQWKWNHSVRCSMPSYIPNLVKKLQHVPPLKPQHSPHPAPQIEYGSKIQEPLPEDDSPLLPAQGITYIQRIIGAALYLARIIDSTLLVACNDIAIKQTAATTKTLSLAKFMLDYMISNPDPSITFFKSDMQLWVVSDASYLSVSKSRSRVGGFHFLGNIPDDTKPLSQQPKFFNAPIHVEASILKPVVSAASEAEIAAGYVNARKAIPLRIALLEMGHPQHPTPLEMDNDTAFGVLTSRIIPKKSKAIDMRFYWLRDRENQKQFKLYWCKGENNLADYFTKHHTTPYHKKMRKIYLSSCLLGSFNQEEFNTLRHVFPINSGLRL